MIRFRHLSFIEWGLNLRGMFVLAILALVTALFHVELAYFPTHSISINILDYKIEI